MNCDHSTKLSINMSYVTQSSDMVPCLHSALPTIPRLCQTALVSSRVLTNRPADFLSLQDHDWTTPEIHGPTRPTLDVRFPGYQIQWIMELKTNRKHAQSLGLKMNGWFNRSIPQMNFPGSNISFLQGSVILSQIATSTRSSRDIYLLILSVPKVTLASDEKRL